MKFKGLINKIRLLHEKHTDVASDSATSPEILYSYTLPANTVNKDGMVLKIKMWGQCSANTNFKNIRMIMGSVPLSICTYFTSTFSDVFLMEAIVIRTGAATQRFIAANQGPGYITPTFQGDGTEDWSTDLDIELEATNITAVANEVIAKGMTVELLEI